MFKTGDLIRMYGNLNVDSLGIITDIAHNNMCKVHWMIKPGYKGEPLIKWYPMKWLKKIS